MIAPTWCPSGTAWAAIVTVLLIGCSGSSTAPPARGSIRTTVTTTGANIDPDGYELDLFGPSNRSLTITANNEVLLADLTGGQYQPQLKDVAANCAVDGANPMDATVVVGDTASVDFGVTCQ